MPTAVVTHAYRTPIGKFLGGFSDLSSVDLGVAVTKGLIERAGIDAASVEQMIFGNARQAGAGPNPARQIAIKSGMADSTVSLTINMACASGLKSIVMAAQAIERGEAEVVMAGGTESMTRLPYLLPRARDGYRMGHAKVVDAMYADGFQCPLAGQLMGATAENLAEKYDISRQRQDEYAVLTQQRCQSAREAGNFEAEIIPVEIPVRRGDPKVLSIDEHPRDGANVDSMAKLKPVFKADGTVHPGNSSGITDGAAAVLVMSEERAKAEGLPILARIEAKSLVQRQPVLKPTLSWKET